MLPAGVIDRIDRDDKKVFVSRTKDEIKSAPEFDEELGFSEDYRASLGEYYGQPVGTGRTRDTSRATGVDVHDGRHPGTPHRGLRGLEKPRSPFRQVPRRIGLREQLRPVAASQAEERRRAEQLRFVEARA